MVVIEEHERRIRMARRRGGGLKLYPGNLVRTTVRRGPAPWYRPSVSGGPQNDEMRGSISSLLVASADNSRQVTREMRSGDSVSKRWSRVEPVGQDRWIVRNSSERTGPSSARPASVQAA